MRTCIMLEQSYEVVAAMNFGTCPEEQNSDDSDIDVESDDSSDDYR